MSASVLIQRLNMLAKSDNGEIAMQALHRLADLEIQSNKSESKAGALKDEIKSLKKELEQSRQQHEAAVQDSAALSAKIAALEPVAARASDLESENGVLNASREEWEAAKVTELTADAKAKLQRAEAAEQRAKEITAQVEAKYSNERLSHTMQSFQKIASRTQMPDFWALEARKHSSLFWQAWWTPERAPLWTALENSFVGNPDNFRAWAVRIVHAEICGYCEKEAINELTEKAAFVRAKAESLGGDTMESIQAEAEQQRDAHLHWHKDRQHAAAATYERQIALSGVGRQPFSDSTQQSSSVPLSEHLAGCTCHRCGGRLPAHLAGGEMTEAL